MHPLLTKNAAQTSAVVSRTFFAHDALGAALPSEWQAAYYNTTRVDLAACGTRGVSWLVTGLAACRR